MILFVKRYLFIIAISLCSFFLANYLYIESVNMMKINVRKDLGLFGDLAQVKVLLLGDSHIEQGLDPDIIPDSYNWAVGAENYKFTYYKLRTLVEKENNVRTIVLPVDINSFLKGEGNCSDVFYWKNYLDTKNLVDCSSKNKLEIFLNKYFPIIGKGEEIIEVLSGKQETSLFKGYYNENRIISSDEMGVSAISRTAYVSAGVKIKKELLDSFVRTLELARDKGIRVILVKPPLSVEYKKTVSKNLDVSLYYEDIFGAIPENFEYSLFDFQDNLDDIRYFSDADHVNRSGSKIFSEKFKIFLDDYIL